MKHKPSLHTAKTGNLNHFSNHLQFNPSVHENLVALFTLARKKNINHVSFVNLYNFPWLCFVIQFPLKKDGIPRVKLYELPA